MLFSLNDKVIKSFIVKLYLLLIFLLSASKGFRFFVDSQTYFDGYTDPLMQVVVSLYPFLSVVLSAVSLRIVYLLASSSSLVVWFTFLNPYFLLLVTNITKEQLAFIGISIIFINPSLCIPAEFGNAIIRRFAVIGLYAFAIVLSMSRIFILPYAFILLVQPCLGKRFRGYLLLVLFVMGLFLVLMYSEFTLDFLFSNFSDRSIFHHTGRDFFNEICYSERSALLTFVSCASSAILGFPVHKDMLSFNYVVYLSLIFPYYLGLSAILNVRYFSYISFLVFIILGFIMQLFIFWWSPTLGAYMRYSLPMSWSLSFALLKFRAALVRFC